MNKFVLPRLNRGRLCWVLLVLNGMMGLSLARASSPAFDPPRENAYDGHSDGGGDGGGFSHKTSNGDLGGGGPSGMPNRPQIERIMRKYQERYYYARKYYGPQSPYFVEWPDCRECSSCSHATSKPLLYPQDEAYGKDISPARARFLLNMFYQQWKSGVHAAGDVLWSYYVDEVKAKNTSNAGESTTCSGGILQGSTVPALEVGFAYYLSITYHVYDPRFTLPDKWDPISDVPDDELDDVANYFEEQLDILNYMVCQPTGPATGLWDSRYGSTFGPISTICNDEKARAHSNWAGNSWDCEDLNVPGGETIGIGMFEYTSTPSWASPYKEASKGAARNYFVVHKQWVGNEFEKKPELYVSISALAGGLSNAPECLTNDGRWHSWGGEPFPDTNRVRYYDIYSCYYDPSDTRSYYAAYGRYRWPMMADSEPEFTSNCPVDGVVKGWRVVVLTMIAKPTFKLPIDEDGCGGGKNACSLGEHLAELSSLQMSFSLGAVSSDHSAGEVVLKTDLPYSELSKQSSLLALLPSGASGVTKITNPSGILRQVKTPMGLMDIFDEEDGSPPTDTNAYKYRIRFYQADQVSSGLTGGVYTITSGTWFKEITVENPDFVPGVSTDPPADFNRLKFTVRKTAGVIDAIYEYEYSEADQEWRLKSGYDGTNLTRYESKQEVWNTEETQRTETTRVYSLTTAGAMDQIQGMKREVYQVFPWGEELIKRVVWHDAAKAAAGDETEQLVTTWSYYTQEVLIPQSFPAPPPNPLLADPGDPAKSYGKLAMVTYPNGHWERYVYGADGQSGQDYELYVTPRYAGQPTDRTLNEYRVTRTTMGFADYFNAMGSPGSDSKNETVITTTELDQGVEVARSYTIYGEGTASDFSWDIRCRNPQALWDDATNVVSFTESHKWGTASEGEPKRTISPDGRLSVYTYNGSATSTTFGALKVNTVKTGVPNGTYTDVVHGTLSITRVGSEASTGKRTLGATIYSETQSIRPSLANQTTSRQEAVSVDHFGRVTEYQYLDGTTTSTSYDCCNVSSRTDRNGAVTTYTYDSQQRLKTVTTAQGTDAELTTTYSYDASGRMLSSTSGSLPATESKFDLAGRLIRSTDVEGHNTYYSYRLIQPVTGPVNPSPAVTYSESRVYPHNKDLGPAWVTWYDNRGNAVFESAAQSATDWSATTPPTGAETLTELSRTVTNLDWRGRTTSTRQYHSLNGLAFGQEPAPVTAKDHYYETKVLAYDNATDQVLRAKDAMGNVSATVFDAGGRPVEQWVGTDDTGATPTDPSGGGSNTLRKVAVTEYENFQVKKSWGLKPNLTALPANATPLATYYDATEYEYDFADRVTLTKPAHGPWSKQVYAGPTDTSGPTANTSARRGRLLESQTLKNGSTTYVLSKSEPIYDEFGRVIAQRTYEVNGSGSTTGNYLESTVKYDDAGRPYWSQSPGGAISITRFDDEGRVERSLLVSSDNNTPDNVSDDTVLTESVPTYDDGGSVIQTTTYDRNHDATISGLLSSNASSARIRYTAAWYDEGHRLTHSADYGDNGGASFTRPTTPPAPNSSDDVIVSQVTYEQTGKQGFVTDNKGHKTHWQYDALGRTLKVVENYVDGIPGTDNDRTTTYTYNADSQIITQTAVDPNGDGDTSDNQTTRYVYSGQLQDKGSPVSSNSLLRAVIYPDSDDQLLGAAIVDGLDVTYDRVETTYYADGALRTRKDARGVELTNIYDPASRLSEQNVTVAPVGLEGDRQITHTYDDLGRMQTLSAYAAVGVAPPSSQVRLTYDGLGHVTKEYQQHGAAVNTTTSPKVEYGYDATTSGSLFTKAHRPSSLTYPSGRSLTFDYASGIPDALSRISGIKEGTTTLAAYSQMGSGMTVKREHPAVTNTLKLDYAGGSGYPGWDRFDRVIDHKWTVGTTDVERIKHGYDRNSNRIHRENTVATSAHDELYAYDNLQRLIHSKRGDLNAGLTAISTLSHAQEWSLDSVGNWSVFKQDGDGNGTFELNQPRLHNKANEITRIDGADAPDPVGGLLAPPPPAGGVDPVHDRAGNMTKMPQPQAGASAYAASYDAWNRLVKLMDGANTLAEYQYDARGRRIVKKSYTSGTLSETRHFYYSNDWQVLEERIGTSANPNTQYVWGLNYVDELVCRDRDANGGTSGDGTLEQAHYVVQDANFNVTALINTSGSVAERYRYTPYGQRTVLDDNFALDSDGVSDVAFVHGHQGLRHDADSGLVENRNRVLHVTLGRFVQRDPMGYVDGMGLYEYIRGNPLYRLDPFGLHEYQNPKGNWGHHPIPKQLWGTEGSDLSLGHSLSEDAKNLFQFTYTGDTNPKHGNVTIESGSSATTHPAYNKAVHDEMCDYMEEKGISKKRKMTKNEAVEFRDRIWTGNGIKNRERFNTIVTFNKAIDKQVTGHGTIGKGLQNANSNVTNKREITIRGVAIFTALIAIANNAANADHNTHSLLQYIEQLEKAYTSQFDEGIDLYSLSVMQEISGMLGGAPDFSVARAAQLLAEALKDGRK